MFPDGDATCDLTPLRRLVDDHPGRVAVPALGNITFKPLTAREPSGNASTCSADVDPWLASIVVA
jgi:hypothetical protein